jgi:hypothetical protein
LLEWSLARRSIQFDFGGLTDRRAGKGRQRPKEVIATMDPPSNELIIPVLIGGAILPS